MRSQDETALIAFARFKDDLSTGLANLVTFYNPGNYIQFVVNTSIALALLSSTDVIALGGGLSQAKEVFEGLEALVDAKTLPATRGKVKILPAALSVDAGAIGAALLGRLEWENSKKLQT